MDETSKVKFNSDQMDLLLVGLILDPGNSILLVVHEVSCSGHTADGYKQTRAYSIGAQTLVTRLFPISVQRASG